MSERLRLTNDGTVVIPGSGPGALKVGGTPSDNRTNTALQVQGSIASWANNDNSLTDIFAADLNFYNNGTSPTWAGAGIRWYGKTAPGNWGSTDIPLAKMALFIGQNATSTALAVNGLGTIYVLNGNGVAIRVNPNLTTSFFGNQATTVAAGEVQIGGGQINASGNIYVQATGTNNASLSLKGASGGTNYYLSSNQGGDQFAIYDGAASSNRLTLSGGTFTFLGTAPTTVAAGQVAIGGGRVMVGGTLSAKEIKVTTSGADYVFEDGYRLRSLDEVAAYVAAHKHLPEMMSAKDMQEGGMPVAEVVTRQLAKIEELTLYVIAGDRERKLLTEHAAAIEKRNAALEGILGALSARLECIEASRGALAIPGQAKP
ncbi:MAG: hypothetical protein H0X38_00880 [Planctomycetes bacterium]|nr:hypothetical protein [Planctomycetota bacterium]